MTEEERLRLEAEAEAEAEAEFQYQQQFSMADGSQLAQGASSPAPTEDPTFVSALAGGQPSVFENALQWGQDIITAPWKVGEGLGALAADTYVDYATAPLRGEMQSLPSSVANSLYQGTADPESSYKTAANIAKRTGDIALGSIPIVGPAIQTGFDAGTDYLMGELKPGAEYGKQLREGIALGGAQGLLMAAPNTKRVSPRTTAVNEFTQDPSTQAALRIVNRENPNLLGQQSPESVSLTPSLKNQIEAKQNIANLGKSDYLGFQLGVNKNTSLNEVGADKIWNQKVSPVLNDPDILSAPDVPVLAKVAKSKAEAAGEARTIYAQQFDNQSFDASIFDPVMKQLGAEAQWLKSSSPQTQAMGAALDDLISTFRAWAGNKYEWKPSDLVNTSEAFNLFRRAQGEFNKNRQGVIARGDVPSALAEEVATSYLPKIQEHINATLDRLGATEANPTPFSDLQSQYGGYKALQTQAEQAAVSTKRGLTRRDPTAIVQNGSSANTPNGFDIRQPISSGVTGAVNNSIGQWWNNLLGRSSQESIDALAASTRNRTIMDDVRDFHYLENNPIDITRMRALSNNPRTMDALAMLQQTVSGFSPRQILSRTWDILKRDPHAMQEVAARAAALGVVNFLQLPEPAQRQVHKALIQTDPAGFEPTPGNYTTADGKFLVPMEKDAHIENGLTLSPEQRAKVVGAALSDNRFVPIESDPIPGVPQKPALPVTMDRLRKALELPAPTPDVAADYSFDGEQRSVIDELNESIRIHSADYIQ